MLGLDINHTRLQTLIICNRSPESQSDFTVREAYLYIVKILVCMVQDEPDFQSLIIIDLANVKVKVVKN